MCVSTYNDLLHMVAPRIGRYDTAMRNSVSSTQSISSTLHFFATGQPSAGPKFMTALAPKTLSRTLLFLL
jgi:hypothetical protein